VQRLRVAEELARNQTFQLERNEQALETLRQQLEQARCREQALEVELSRHVQLSHHHQQEAQIWELLQSTLTEGCWDITVVNGNVQD
ncbi:histidine kinase, partial [Pseudomonas sp. FW305-BF6]